MFLRFFATQPDYTGASPGDRIGLAFTPLTPPLASRCAHEEVVESRKWSLLLRESESQNAGEEKRTVQHDDAQHRLCLISMHLSLIWSYNRLGFSQNV